MDDPSESPPFRWLLGSAQQREIARRYWIRDTILGLYELTLYRTLRLMPIDVCSGIGALIANISRYWFCDSERRAREVWIRLRPNESDRASVDAAMTRLWKCVSRTMAEFSVLDRLWAEGRIAVEGAEHLAQARAQKKPVLIAGMHLGNWEALGAVGQGIGHPVVGLYLPPENRFERRIAVEFRENLGLTLVAAGPQSARAAIRVLKEQAGTFAIYIDEFIRNRVHAPAFGRPLRAEGNIAYIVRLAALTGAFIIPAYCVRLGGAARFKVMILPPVDLVDTGNKEADLMQNIAKIDAIIAPIIRDHLDQWYYALDFEFDS